MGIPKMTVSLIFTKLGNKEIFAIRRLSCLREKTSIYITTPNVHPEPPTSPNI